MSWDALSLGNKCLKSRPGRDCRLQFAITSLIEYAIARSVLMTLNQLRLWIESKPDGPEGEWYKDFGSFKLRGEGNTRKHFS